MANNSLVLRFKKRSPREILIWLVLVLPFLFVLVMDIMHMPSAVKYICDVCWVLLLFLMMLSRYRNVWKARVLRMFIVCFFVYTLLSYLVEFKSIYYYLWGARNNFRYFAYFFAVAMFFNKDDIDDSLKLFDRLFWVNIVVCLVQYFALGFKGDQLGGLFGTVEGSNSFTNIFFCIMTTKSLVFYLQKKEKLSVCIARCVAILIVVAFAELKFFFVEFAIILILAVVFARFSFRKAFFTIFGFLMLMVAVQLMSIIFPFFENFFSIESIVEYAGQAGYTNKGDVNRLTVITTTIDRWLKTPAEQLFGFGLGNCDYASGYDFLTTEFFKRFEGTHYTWFSIAFMFLECGYIGLAFYIGFFILTFFMIKRIEKTLDQEDKTYCHFSSIMCICCLMFILYNSSMRMDCGYMAYFTLAFPFIIKKCAQKQVGE